MAELKRKDDELTTADLAGSTEKPRDLDSRPQLVRNEQKLESERNTGPVNTRVRDDDQTAVRLADQAARDRTQVQASPATTPKDIQSSPLFAESEVGDFRSRWSGVQTAFVDEPRRAVEDADNLVASLMKKLAEGFANERSRLEGQWDRGDHVSTEDLRLALQRYRLFFDRLLKV